MIKRDIRWGDLNDALADKTLNLDHEYVQYILSKPRRSLCVVYETVATHGDCDLGSDSLEQGVVYITLCIHLTLENPSSSYYNVLIFLFIIILSLNTLFIHTDKGTWSHFN